MIPLAQRPYLPGARLVLALVLAPLAACATRGATPATPVPVAGEASEGLPPGHPPLPPGHPPVARGNLLERAALPFAAVRVRDGEKLSPHELVAELGRARAVCIGETHDNPHDHWVQWQLLSQLAEQAAKQGVELGLGMEMFERPLQPALDDFLAGRSGEHAFLSRVGWQKSWGFDWQLYRPMVLVAKGGRSPIVALNARRDLVRWVARLGLEKVSPKSRAEIPKLDLDDARHRAYFRSAMEGHEMRGSSFDHFYQAQVLRDETMAETARGWLAAKANRRMVILAGNGHCHDAAIPNRLRRRGMSTLSVATILDDGDGSVATRLVARETDILVVLKVP